MLLKPTAKKETNLLRNLEKFRKLESQEYSIGIDLMSIFKARDYMTDEQLSIADSFQQLIESEYEICVAEILRTGQAMRESKAIDEGRKIELANREINSLHLYWQRRLFSLLEFLETQDYQFCKELKIR
jgi:tmRNA-binding protein